MPSSTWAAARPPLTGVLLDRGFGDLTVLDISAAGMQHARARLGPRADQVHWLTADVLSWYPSRRYQAWHDRAVYHGRAHHPGRHHPAVHLDRAAKTILNPES